MSVVKAPMERCMRNAERTTSPVSLTLYPQAHYMLLGFFYLIRSTGLPTATDQKQLWVDKDIYSSILPQTLQDVNL